MSERHWVRHPGRHEDLWACALSVWRSNWLSTWDPWHPWWRRADRCTLVLETLGASCRQCWMCEPEGTVCSRERTWTFEGSALWARHQPGRSQFSRRQMCKCCDKPVGIKNRDWGFIPFDQSESGFFNRNLDQIADQLEIWKRICFYNNNNNNITLILRMYHMNMFTCALQYDS